MAGAARCGDGGNQSAPGIPQTVFTPDHVCKSYHVELMHLLIDRSYKHIVGAGYNVSSVSAHQQAAPIQAGHAASRLALIIQKYYI